MELAGLLQRGREPSSGAVVVCHCFTCSKDYKSLAWLARALAQFGFTVLRFDFAGLGDSSGDFRDTNLSTDIEDLIAATDWLERVQGERLLGLVGHSMGGAAAILAAARRPDPVPVAVLGTSGVVGGRIRRLLHPGDFENLERTGETTVTIHRRRFPLTVEFLQDLERHDLLRVVAGWRCPLLVVHGTDDAIVPFADAEELYAAATAPKSFLTVPAGDHLFVARRSLAPSVARVLAGWFELHASSINQNGESL